MRFLLPLLIAGYCCNAQADISATGTILNQTGQNIINFKTPQGLTRINLPDDMRAGDEVSGRLTREAAGNTSKQVQRNLRVLEKYRVSLNNSVIESPAQFQTAIRTTVTTNNAQAGMWSLALHDESNKLLTQVNWRTSQPVSNRQECTPAHILAGSPLSIPGKFDGNSENTKVNFKGLPLEILAESPRQIIVRIPPEATGMNDINVRDGNSEICNKTVRAVQLDVSAGKLNLVKGERSFIDVRIRGLQDIRDPVTLRLNNMNTGTVTLEPSNNITVAIPKDSIAGGTYFSHYNIQSNRTGSFSVNVDLELPGYQPVIKVEPEPPPFLYEQKPLPEPRRLETEALQIGLHMAIKKLVADAGGARGQEWNTVCDNCRQCFEARMGKWAEDLVRDLGVGIMKEFAGKAVDLIAKSVDKLEKVKEFFDKISDNLDKADKLAEDLEKKIRAGELQVMELLPEMCKKSEYCLISGTIFYSPVTGCVVAILKCTGTKLCCPETQTTVTISYCTDDKGMPKGIPDVHVIK